MKVHFVLWKWNQAGFRETYNANHVNVMASMIRRNLLSPHRTICVTDDPKGIEVETFPLWRDHGAMHNACGPHLPSCYRRLKLFDTETWTSLGIDRGDRVISIDLDSVICQDISNIVAREETFLGWGVKGTHHDLVFNGSMFGFIAGECEHLWKNFDPVKSPTEALRARYLGSDQAWLSYNQVNKRGSGSWTAAKDGVLSYVKDVRAFRILPRHTRIVFFHGRRKPWDPDVQRESPWIKRYWTM